MLKSDRNELQARNAGDRVRGVSELEHGRPVGVNGLAGEGVNLAEPGVVEADAVNEAELRAKSAHNAHRLLRALGAKHAIQPAGVVEDGNSAGGPGKGILGIVLCEGEYFWIDGKGCFTLNELCEQGRILSCEKGEFSYALAYVLKYVLKRLPEAQE